MLSLVGPIMETSAPEDELNPAIRTKRIFRQFDKSHKGFLLFEDFAEGIKGDPIISKLMLEDPAPRR